MNTVIISGSNRVNSGSRKVSNYVSFSLTEKGSDSTLWDLSKINIPLWTEDLWNPESEQSKMWFSFREELSECDALVIVAAEWNGSIPPSLHNFIMHLGSEVSHKPVLLISVTAGTTNGAYPIAELRAFSTKNNRMLMIPDHVIVRNIGSVLETTLVDESDTEDYLTKTRLTASVEELLLYAKHMRAVREELTFDYKEFRNGM